MQCAPRVAAISSSKQEASRYCIIIIELKKNSEKTPTTIRSGTAALITVSCMTFWKTRAWPTN